MEGLDQLEKTPFELCPKLLGQPVRIDSPAERHGGEGALQSAGRRPTSIGCPVNTGKALTSKRKPSGVCSSHPWAVEGGKSE